MTVIGILAGALGQHEVVGHEEQQDEREQQHQGGAEVLQGTLQEEQLDLVPIIVVFGEPDTIAFV